MLKKNKKIPQLFGAIFFTQLQTAGTNIKVFQWMYYMSSFFNQVSEVGSDARKEEKAHNSFPPLAVRAKLYHC